MSNEIFTVSIETKKVKMPVIAGMKFNPSTGTISDYKMRKVGYDIFEQTFNVYTYPNGYKDFEFAGSKRIKRVIF